MRILETSKLAMVAVITKGKIGSLWIFSSRMQIENMFLFFSGARASDSCLPFFRNGVTVKYEDKKLWEDYGYHLFLQSRVDKSYVLDAAYDLVILRLLLVSTGTCSCVTT